MRSLLEKPDGSVKQCIQSNRIFFSLQAPKKKNRTGFSILELLTVLVVISILFSLILISVSSVRQQSRRAVCLSHVRTLLIGVNAYSNEAAGYPPSLFKPGIGSYTIDPPQIVDLNGHIARGFWFYSSFMYHHLLMPTMPGLEIYAPGTPEDRRGEAPSWESSQYYLTETLYGSPSMWRQQGATLRDLRAQRLDDVRFPDRKGLIQQEVAYFEKGGVTSAGDPVLLWMNTRIPGAVAWADQSASTVVQSRLEPGVPNPLDHGAFFNGGVSWGFPILRTRDGIHGFDRSTTNR